LEHYYNAVSDGQSTA